MSWQPKLANGVKSRSESQSTKDRKQIFACDKELIVGFLAPYQQIAVGVRKGEGNGGHEGGKTPKEYVWEKRNVPGKISEELSLGDPFCSFDVYGEAGNNDNDGMFLLVLEWETLVYI